MSAVSLVTPAVYPCLAAFRFSDGPVRSLQSCRLENSGVWRGLVRRSLPVRAVDVDFARPGESAQETVRGARVRETRSRHQFHELQLLAPGERAADAVGNGVLLLTRNTVADLAYWNYLIKWFCLMLLPLLRDSLLG